MENTKLPVILITAGDPNGIGYEVILKTFADTHIFELCRPVVYGNMAVAQKHLQTLDTNLVEVPMTVINNPTEAQEGKLCFINCYDDNLRLDIGQSTKEGGQASYLSLQRAVQDIKQYGIKLLVTAPINKENIQSEQFHYSGHTEFLTDVFQANNSLMMMASQQMIVALVSNHVPLSKVPLHINEERILSKLKLLNRSLELNFRRKKSRIAVLALNPHAGDNDLLGTEESQIIKPAIKRAIEEGINAFGPYSADGFFGSGHYRHFDAILAMYHDKGLIAFKAVDMDGVNFTAGLPIIRTSPDHGTAYEIAGKNEACCLSFKHATLMALDICRIRMEEEKLRRGAMKNEE